MKLTVQIQLLPDPIMSAQLKATVERFNAAANWLAGEAVTRQVSNKIVLQRLYYRELRDRFDLSAQMAVRCLAQVCEASKRDRTRRPRFRRHAAMPYDQRLMSFQGIERVSLLTLDGRVIVPMVMGQYQAKQFPNPKGQADLVLRHDGSWFLLVTIDRPDGIKPPVSDFIGVDLGVVNLATTSDADQYSGDRIEATRTRLTRRRQELGKALGARNRRGQRPRQIHQAMRRMRRREARFRRDTNHIISKRLVALAKDTGRGITLEDLKGIRTRTRFRRRQRGRINGWSFRQLRQFIDYKADLAGVAVVIVDPRNTSRTCPECDHCARANRRSQSAFECRACGHRSHADLVGARNIRARAVCHAAPGLGTTTEHFGGPVQGQAAAL